jgi:hypothetical protein
MTKTPASLRSDPRPLCSTTLAGLLRNHWPISAEYADEGKRILRFDCFYKNPHYHVGASGGEQAAHKMKDEGVEDPVRWTLEQLKTRFPAMVKQAGYEEIAERIDQQMITDQLTRLEREIIAKY